MAEAKAAKRPARPPAPDKPKRKRKRATAKAAPAPVAAAPRAPAAKAQGEGPAPLNEVVMAQTAESLAALSANLTHAMTRANQVFSTAFIDQAKDVANWQHDPLG